MVKPKTKYVPQKGDIVWIIFSSAKGHEQKGKRPALVVSSSLYNEKSGLALFCPITSQKKDYPFEVELKDSGTKGVILADQIRTFDFDERRVEFIEKAPEKVMAETIRKISLLITS